MGAGAPLQRQYTMAMTIRGDLHTDNLGATRVCANQHTYKFVVWVSGNWYPHNDRLKEET